TYTRAGKLMHWFACARITGGSRAFTHQLVRHRRMAASQESQRYCDETGIYENDYYVIPPSIEEAGLGDYYMEKIKLIDSWYRELQRIIKEAGTGRANEDARFLLPNACCAEIVISCNLQEWRQIFKMRTDSHAQWEIRNGMIQILRQFQELFPGCFDDFKIVNEAPAVILT
ncbi:MAG: FAD-dependent thymidylate synthase, partial [Patescibacteria group bacterium]